MYQSTHTHKKAHQQRASKRRQQQDTKKGPNEAARQRWEEPSMTADP